MGLITHHSASGYRCDDTKCLAKVQGEQMPIYLAEQYYREIARDEGWTFWQGRRLWVYCPAHRPDANRGLTEIVPDTEVTNG